MTRSRPALSSTARTVAWVGSDEAADAQAAAVDDVVELEGALVTPAFVDAHVHVTETGLALGGVDVRCRRVRCGEVLGAVERAAAPRRRAPGARPRLGRAGPRRGPPPTAAELDRASAGGAVYLARVDAHSADRLQRARRGGRRARPRRLDRRRAGRARRAPRRPNSHADGPRGPAREHAQRTALRAAAGAGIGCVHEASAPHIAPEVDLRSLVALAGVDHPMDHGADHGAEPLPEVVPYRGQLVADEAQARAVVERLGVPLAGLAGDLNADGAVGSRTASFRAAYADAPGTSGHTYLSVEQVRDHVVACTAAGLQAGFHVIGDAALDVVLEGFRRAAERAGIAAVRAGGHRLEHVETPDADAVARLADLGLTASVQPAFDAAWGGPSGMYAQRLGPERAVAMNPFASLAAAGVPLAFGSDSPVTPFAPWEAVRAAAFHTEPDQRISARAAFAAHTRGAWRAARRPATACSPSAPPPRWRCGRPASLVVQAPDDRIQAWSTDPRSGTPGLPDLSPGVPAPRCLRTVVAGRVVFDAAA